MTPQLFQLIFLGCALASVRGQDDEWIDPYNMTHYDSTSKTMRKTPEEAKATDTEGTPSRDLDQNEISSPEISQCSKKLLSLQRAIEDIKHKASDLKQQPGFISARNSKLDQLLKNIQQLSMPNEDDFCHVPWQITYLEEVGRCISVGLLTIATHFTNLSDVLFQPDVTCWLVPVGWFVTILMLVCIAVKWWRRQPDHRDGHEQHQENDLQNDDREQKHQEGDRDNLDPEGRGQEPVPPAEDVGAEEVDGSTDSEPPGQQEPDASEDECCDENYSITKMPISETQPEMQHSAE
ncbi:hypothetical protein SKAU_G00067440 [Synaphobranchus kaupii]|uniref:Chloride channel CLIC-like protein 1 n=1 Tax=Synaphobranchus kaupii TaxID=118154 RepID=A0A9Q1G795_SYNKA|nr:hypothetical protein SKAU_G00067440 [Synaphobranchus kaupii]